MLLVLIQCSATPLTSVPLRVLMYSDPQQQRNQPPPAQGVEYQTGPLPPQLMRQPSASSSTLNLEYHHPAPPQILSYDDNSSWNGVPSHCSARW
ncbi:hypothetical protein CCACVL1_14664 [Corchorus capsularis]|uniref:Uncharacterized protein n=1 Tax=Corchorus capsularis TaxID=210143 RepID=A0A1R3I660_COCAP|nr:hypothetical protein CCACVL1_14664 [Corchorus capsularis]